MMKVVSILISVKSNLLDKLIGIWNNNDFIVGVMSNAATEENYQRVIGFIENESQRPADITAFSASLDFAIDDNGEYVVGADGLYVRQDA